MAHFAELDDNNIVQRVIVVNNDVLLDEQGNEVEQLGVDFCKTIYGSDTNWKQCSYNWNFRYCFPIPGFVYFEDLDIFNQSKPADYFILEEFENPDGDYTVIKMWVPNVPYPDPTYKTEYDWNFETRSWDLVE